jgi:hypothetical protein
MTVHRERLKQDIQEIEFNQVLVILSNINENFNDPAFTASFDAAYHTVSDDLEAYRRMRVIHR